MNILFSSLGGHDLTQSLHYVRVLERMGHNVYRFVLARPFEDSSTGYFVEPGFTPDTPMEAIVRLAGFKPDLFLFIDPNGLIPRGIERADFPTACLLCDTHTDLKLRLRYARFFDHVFLYHRNYLKFFNEHPASHVHWSPYACDLELFHPMEAKRDYDVAFIGYVHGSEERKRLITFIKQRYSMNEQRYYLQSEIPQVYARAKIVLNLPLADDLNFRTFEAMSCGALLLTRRINNGQELLFEEDKHYVAFSDERELRDKLDYYLSHPAEREAIALAGLAEIQLRHRLEQRVTELLETVCQQPQPVAPVRTMPQSQLTLQYAWLYEHFHRSDPDASLTLVRQARVAGQPWLQLLLPATRSVFRTLFR